MRTLTVVAAASLALVTPTAALAQDAEPAPAESSLSDLSEKLSDPLFQDQAAAMVGALMGALLELPIGPIAEAVDQATGGEGPDIDPDARIVDLAPETEDLPREVSERLPQAMSAMSGMAEGLETMLPALRDMAERMKVAMEDGRAR